MSRQDLHDVTVYLRRETEKAWGIASAKDPGEIIWLPKSQCKLERHEGPGKIVTLTAPEWLLDQKGLI